jgi:hypothetical protein
MCNKLMTKNSDFILPVGGRILECSWYIYIYITDHDK